MEETQLPHKLIENNLNISVNEKGSLEVTKIGRPTLFTKELGDRICEELALGISMRSVTKEEWCPAMSTIFKWIRENKEFMEQYARAKEESTDAMSEDIMDIADDSTGDFSIEQIAGDKEVKRLNNENVQRSRLRVDTRKWLMSKMKPKKYGDKLDMTTNGKDLPIPLLNGIYNNISNTKNSEPNEEN